MPHKIINNPQRKPAIPIRGNRINSRTKGNKNERVVAELLTKWTNKPFSRTPSSGGLQWKSSNSKGDVVCTKEGHFFPFCVEVKAHKEIDFSQLLNPKLKNVKVLEFWEQCSRDAKRANKVPLLFMRYNGMPKDFFFVALELNFWKSLFPNLAIALTINTKFEYSNKKEKIHLILLQSTEFINLPYKEIKLLTKKFLK